MNMFLFYPYSSKEIHVLNFTNSEHVWKLTYIQASHVTFISLCLHARTVLYLTCT